MWVEGWESLDLILFKQLSLWVASKWHFKASWAFDDDDFKYIEFPIEDEEEIYHDKDLEVEDEIVRKDDENELEEDKIDSNELSVDEELDINEIEKIYKDSDVKFDENITKTSTLIKEALKDNKIFEKKQFSANNIFFYVTKFLEWN